MTKYIANYNLRDDYNSTVVIKQQQSVAKIPLQQHSSCSLRVLLSISSRLYRSTLSL